MNTKLIIHIVISLISLSGLIVYYYAFLLGYKKHNSQLKKQSKLPEKLYFMSTYPALIWYVLPFIEQPRMHGIYDWLNGEFVFFNVLYIPVSFLLFVYFFGIWGKKSVSQNIEATKSAFYAPSKLLTEGIYARVQHPMIIGDILGHFSLVLLTGGIYTCILFPIYVFIDLFMIKIQVKYSLEPYYKSELIVYRKKTPVLLDQKLLFIVLFMALLVICNFLNYTKNNMIYFSWATQIILAIISFLWLIPYYIAFKVGNRKYMSKTLDLSCNNRYTLMYYSGFFISILWYIMPFLNQPRFKLNIFSLFDIKVILLENVLYNIILIALIGYFMSVWGTKVVNCNLQATKDRFLHPSKLITEGPYKKVRNPMIMGDLFCHLSFILLLGAIHTLCLYIIYICINLVIVYIENKYSLCIHFKKEYEEYAKKTPAYMNQELWLFAIFYLVIIVTNICLTTTIYI